MKQSQIRLTRTASKNYPIISSQSKQHVIIKCKHCDLKAVKAITPSGTTLYYCVNKSCNFSGQIVTQIIKTNEKDRFLYY